MLIALCHCYALGNTDVHNLFRIIRHTFYIFCLYMYFVPACR